MLELGGSVEVVLPAADYRERKVKADNAARATAVHAARQRGIPVTVVWPVGSVR